MRTRRPRARARPARRGAPSRAGAGRLPRLPGRRRSRPRRSARPSVGCDPCGGIGKRLPRLAQRDAAAVAGRARAVDPPLALCDADVVDRGLAPAHQAVAVELPVLVAVGAPPLAALVMPLVLEAHRDVIAAEGPEILAQDVLVLALPLAQEEGMDLGAAAQELIAIAPLRVGRVGEHDATCIARVPRILRGLHLLPCGLLAEGRGRGARGGV